MHDPGVIQDALRNEGEKGENVVSEGIGGGLGLRGISSQLDRE